MAESGLIVVFSSTKLTTPSMAMGTALEELHKSIPYMIQKSSSGTVVRFTVPFHSPTFNSTAFATPSTGFASELIAFILLLSFLLLEAQPLSLLT